MLEIQATLSSWSYLVSPISTHQKTMSVFYGLPQFGNSKVWGNSDRCQPLLASSIYTKHTSSSHWFNGNMCVQGDKRASRACCVAWFLGTIFGPPQKNPVVSQGPLLGTLLQDRWSITHRRGEIRPAHLWGPVWLAGGKDGILKMDISGNHFLSQGWPCCFCSFNSLLTRTAKESSKTIKHQWPYERISSTQFSIFPTKFWSPGIPKRPGPSGQNSSNFYERHWTFVCGGRMKWFW